MPESNRSVRRGGEQSIGCEPAWKLSGFYFFYFALIGGIAPFLPLYLQDLGFTPSQVGVLVAIVMGTKVLAPNLWGWLADKTGARLTLVRIGCLAAIIVFAFVLVAQGFWWHALLLATFSAFWNSVLPQWEVITLFNLGGEPEKYGKVRIGGSLGFIAAVVGLGVFFDLFSIHYLPYWLIAFLAGLMLLALLTQKEPPKSEHAGLRKFLSSLKAPHALIFFLSAFLLQLSFGPYYTFLSIFLENAGYSSTSIGALWALGVAAEVLLLWQVHKILVRYAAFPLLAFGFVLTGLRWLGIGLFVESMTLMICLQLIHAISFGLMHAVSIDFIHRYFGEAHAGQGQALYSAVSFGAGGGLGALVSGYIAETVMISVAFYIGAAVSLGGAGLVYWGQRLQRY